tara:strand:- start:308 stop:592 length:285 start_codon:yes stop_codon:yes gene_type:complete
MSDNIYDIKSKKKFKDADVHVEEQLEWVVTELEKIVNKAIQKKIKPMTVATALSEVATDMSYDFAPNPNQAMLVLMSAIQSRLEFEVEEEMTDD